MADLIGKAREFVKFLNDKGIPVPMIRIEGKPTFTGTMVFLSFNTALLGQLNKLANIVGDVDLTQANYLFMICLGAYLGRRMQKDGKTVTLEGTESSYKEQAENEEVEP